MQQTGESVSRGRRGVQRSPGVIIQSRDHHGRPNHRRRHCSSDVNLICMHADVDDDDDDDDVGELTL